MVKDFNEDLDIIDQPDCCIKMALPCKVILRRKFKLLRTTLASFLPQALIGLLLIFGLQTFLAF